MVEAAQINLSSVVQTMQQSVRAINSLNQTIDGKFPDFFVDVPASATADGTRGQIAANTSFLYICVATNTWRRVAISSF